MRQVIILVLLTAAALAEAAQARKADTWSGKHRRHHYAARNAHNSDKIEELAVKVIQAKSGKTVKTSSKKTPAAVISKSSGSSSSSKTTSSSTGLKGESMNGIYLGFVPDEGDAGGTKETMAQLNQMLGGKAATYGYYAQAHSGTPFDGSQLLAVLDDVVASGAILEAAVMPVGGWQGLTTSDNSQAVAICNVMKQFTSKGVYVRLRFGHEVNYYQSVGTYTGTASDFKMGWATVAAACASNKMVSMFFTPNIANMQQYQQYYPSDPNTVAYCGIDFYPQSLSNGEFVSQMKAFHDYCTKNGKTKFAIGETGLGFAGTPAQRIQWLNQIMTSKSQLPNLVSVSWFNYMKGYDFRLLDSVGGPATKATVAYMK